MPAVAHRCASLAMSPNSPGARVFSHAVLAICDRPSVPPAPLRWPAGTQPAPPRWPAPLLLSLDRHASSLPQGLVRVCPKASTSTNVLLTKQTPIESVAAQTSPSAATGAATELSRSPAPSAVSVCPSAVAWIQALLRSTPPH